MGRGWKVTKRRYQVWEDAGWADPIRFLLKAGQGDQLPSGVGRDGRNEEFDRGEFFLNWLRWIFLKLVSTRSTQMGLFWGLGKGFRRPDQSLAKQRIFVCFINKLPWYCCQLSAMGTCHLPLPRLNHVLLQLLTFNTPWKELRVESRNKALCALGKQGTGRTGLQIASLVAHRVTCLPAMWETWVPSYVRKISWRRKWRPTPVLLPGKSHGWKSLVQTIVHGVAKSRTRLSNFTFTFQVFR